MVDLFCLWGFRRKSWEELDAKGQRLDKKEGNHDTVVVAVVVVTLEVSSGGGNVVKEEDEEWLGPTTRTEMDCCCGL